MRGTSTGAYKILASMIISILLLGYSSAPANARLAAPANLKAIITQTSATLTWLPTSGATFYKVYKDGSLYASPTTNTAPVTGLKADKTYTFKVSAVNSGGEGAKSTLSVTTLPVVPAVPIGITATAITQTSATLTWSATTGATFYKLYIDGSLYASPTTNTAPITGLTARTTYTFTVSAVNAGGESTQSSAVPVTTLPELPTGPTLKVLEVQPGTSYDLTTSLLAEIYPNNKINITQMSMPEFISKVDEINGQYDIVYLGNNTSGKHNYGAYTAGQYMALGGAPVNLPQGGLNNGTGTSQENYSDNDITNRRAKILQEFINSKQLTIFDQSIFGLGIKYKLYNNFITYVNNPSFPNFYAVSTADLSTAFSAYSNVDVAKKPSLTLNSYPKLYDGSDSSYQINKTLGFNFDINNLSNVTNMTAKLYVDFNGDGIFKAVDDYAGTSELVSEKNGLSSGTGYTINYNLSDSCVGLEPWKMELTDTSTGAKSYSLGATAFQATNSNDVLHVRLLQLEPPGVWPGVSTGNTLSINSLRNVGGQNLLSKDMVYHVDVTEMSIVDFNNAYAHSPSSTVTALVNGVTTNNVSTVLNGNYDMIIMGFADIYGNKDLTNASALNALQSFITSKQSVMFTHDTLTFQVNTNPSWGYDITKNFRSIVGQQRYYHTNEMLDATRYYDSMPNSSKDSYGFSNLTLARYNNGINNDGQTFQTSTTTHKVNDNLVTQFPFVLGDIPVSPTHFQYYQLDLEDENVVPVYTYSQDPGGSTYTNASGTITNQQTTIYTSPGDGRNDYYTYSKGSITYSGTGHSQVTGLLEKEMFVNTMIKASRGANHAPTLVVNGITEGMNFANTSPSIDFSFTATDIDSYDQYLNADIYLSTDAGSTYQKVKHYSATDSVVAQRVRSGVAQPVSIQTVNPSPDTYKVKVVVTDSDNAMASQEIEIICQPDPSISVPSFTISCLVGDTVNIPVNLNATATLLNETFKQIELQSITTKLAAVGSPTAIDTHTTNYSPDLTFNPSPDSSWTEIWTETPNNYSLTLGTLGDPNSAGTYSILDKLTYTAYMPPSSTGYPRKLDQSFNIKVGSGTINGVVQDQNGKGISGIPLSVSGISLSGIPLIFSGTSSSTTSGASGAFSFTGLSTGTYTVEVGVLQGRTLDLNKLPGPVSLSADIPTPPSISFTLDGDLMQGSSITTTSGDSQTVINEVGALQTKIVVNLSRPANYIKLALNNSLSGKNMDVVDITCSTNNISLASSDPIPDATDKIIRLMPSSTPFPSGTYTIYATITPIGGTIQAGQSFNISLTKLSSALDPSTGFEENISSTPKPLTVILSPYLH